MDTEIIGPEDLMIICKYWYQATMENSGLWNHINLYGLAVRRYRTPIAYVGVYIRHSRLQLLRVTLRVDDKNPNSTSICQALAATIHRWSEADITIAGMGYLQAGYEFLHAPAPSLHSLRVSMFSTWLEKLDLTQILTDTRSLSNLKICRGDHARPAITLPVMYGSTVKYLELKNFKSSSALPIIHQLPHIVHLRLFQLEAGTDPRNTPSIPISLPFLTTLVLIRIQSEELKHFLDHTFMPNLREVHLSTLCPNSQSNEAILSRLTAEGCKISYV